MHSKERLRRRFLEKISFSKSKQREIIDHHTRHLSLIEQPTPQLVPNSIKDLEIYGFTQGGSGPNKTECQDTFSILHNIANHINFFAVYDGHGPNGKLVSDFVNKNIAGSLTRHALEMEKAVDMGSPGTFFNTMFKSVDNKLMQSTINASFSGSCCISVLISNNKCYIANVGDSRAILCRETPLGQVSVLDLSTDHKPTRQDEQARIFQAGGIIEPSYSNGQPSGPLRVWSHNKESGLATTRAFGDAKGKQAGLIVEPEITQLDLGADDKFIIIASDGVWDVLSSQEAVCFVVNYLKAGKSKSEAAQTLALEAKDRWMKHDAYHQIQYCDDITVVIAFLQYNPPQTTQVTYMDLNTQALVYMP